MRYRGGLFGGSYYERSIVRVFVILCEVEGGGALLLIPDAQSYERLYHYAGTGSGSGSNKMMSACRE